MSTPAATGRTYGAVVVLGPVAVAAPAVPAIAKEAVTAAVTAPVMHLRSLMLCSFASGMDALAVSARPVTSSSPSADIAVTRG
jgi:hypothetical protein